MSRFSESASRRLVAAMKRVEHTPTRTPPPALPTTSAYPGGYIAKTGSGGIAARSGTTPGSATVTLYYVSSGVLTKRTDSSGADVTVTAYNLSTTAVAGDAYIVIQPELLSGKLIATWEDC